MHKKALAQLVCLLLLEACSTTADPPVDPRIAIDAEAAAEVQSYQAAISDAQSGECEPLYSLLRGSQAPEVETERSQTRDAAFESLISCAGQKWETEILRFALSASRSEPSSEAARLAQLVRFAYFDLESTALGQAALTELAREFPGAVSDLDEVFPYGLYARIDKSDVERRLAFLLLLRDDASHRKISVERNDDLNLNIARLQVKSGEMEAAAKSLGEIISPSSLLEMALDESLRPATGAFKPWNRARFSEALGKYEQATADRMNGSFRRLDVLIDRVRSYRINGRNEEAIKLVDPIFDRFVEERAIGDWEDAGSKANWLLNDYAYALYYTGELERSFAAMEASALFPEHSGPNVSQVINRAIILMHAGKFADSLAALEHGDDSYMSDVGRMWVRYVRACANHNLGSYDKAEENLNYMLERAEQNFGAATKALVCFGRSDAAKSLYLRRLADPEARIAAAIALQEYEGEERFQTDLDRKQMEVLAAIRVDPDIVKALGVDRLERLPFQNLYWGAF